MQACFKQIFTVFPKSLPMGLLLLFLLGLRFAKVNGGGGEKEPVSLNTPAIVGHASERSEDEEVLAKLTEYAEWAPKSGAIAAKMNAFVISFVLTEKRAETALKAIHQCARLMPACPDAAAHPSFLVVTPPRADGASPDPTKELKDIMQLADQRNGVLDGKFVHSIGRNMATVEVILLAKAWHSLGKTDALKEKFGKAWVERRKAIDGKRVEIVLVENEYIRCAAGHNKSLDVYTTAFSLLEAKSPFDRIHQVLDRLVRLDAVPGTQKHKLFIKDFAVVRKEELDREQDHRLQPFFQLLHAELTELRNSSRGPKHLWEWTKKLVRLHLGLLAQAHLNLAKAVGEEDAANSVDVLTTIQERFVERLLVMKELERHPELEVDISPASSHVRAGVGSGEVVLEVVEDGNKAKVVRPDGHVTILVNKLHDLGRRVTMDEVADEGERVESAEDKGEK